MRDSVNSRCNTKSKCTHKPTPSVLRSTSATALKAQVKRTKPCYPDVTNYAQSVKTLKKVQSQKSFTTGPADLNQKKLTISIPDDRKPMHPFEKKI